MDNYPLTNFEKALVNINGQGPITWCAEFPIGYNINKQIPCTVGRNKLGNYVVCIDSPYTHAGFCELEINTTSKEKAVRLAAALEQAATNMVKEKANVA